MLGLVAVAPPTRVLRRSKEDFYALGVCGGLGRYFGIDPGWFRVLVILGVDPVSLTP